jgi:hypothetical protein
MSGPPRVTAWPLGIQPHWPHLRKPQATVLALWSLGMGLARSGALTAVRAVLATWLGRTEPAVRQQRRALCEAATAQRGPPRQALVVEPGCAPLWAWGVAQWEGPPLALARAATPWGARLTGLARSGGSRGWASPVAWPVWAATAQPAWRREGWRRWRQGRRAIPRAWTGMGLAERGWSARWRWRRLPRLGWPPCVRINTGGTCRPTGQVRGGPWQTLGPAPGPTWQGPGSACTGRQRQWHGPLLAGGDAGA